jgi:hypothetical protein
MSEQAGFSLVVSQQKYLPRGVRAIHAVLQVRARVGAEATGRVAAEATGRVAAEVPSDGGPPPAAEVIILDCSGSMGKPPQKLAAAVAATCVALDTLRDGVLFAIVAGESQARMVYPVRPTLVPASPETRAHAKKAVGGLYACGGTRMGRWLTLAAELFAAQPGIIRHAMLYTDGRNEHELPDELDSVLRQCQGRFDCDARGIGDGWDPGELRRIVTALHGRADGVSGLAGDLTEDFRGVMREAMRKTVPEVALRLRPGRGVAVDFVRQVFPTEADLTALAVPADKVATDYPTGAWAEERRDFHICLIADPEVRPLGKDERVARADLMKREVGQPRATPACQEKYVLAHWADLPPGPTHLTDLAVEHYAEQGKLGKAVRDGCHAYELGDHERAAAEWGVAVELAHRSDHQQLLIRLRNVVEFIDPAAGQVRLWPADRIVKTDLRLLDIGSAASVSIDMRRLAERPPTAARGVSRSCPAPGCGRISPPGAGFCEQCGLTFDRGVPDEAPPA